MSKDPPIDHTIEIDVKSSEANTVTLYRVNTADIARQIKELPESAGVWLRTQTMCLLDSPPYYVEIWKQEDREGRYFVSPLRTRATASKTALVERIEIEIEKVAGIPEAIEDSTPTAPEIKTE